VKRGGLACLVLTPRVPLVFFADEVPVERFDRPGLVTVGGGLSGEDGLVAGTCGAFNRDAGMRTE
jgi:hypothetical protein